MRDLRSDAQRAAAQERAAQAAKRRAELLEDLAEAKRRCWGQWHPIETAPFEAFSEVWDEEDAVFWVSDGVAIALVKSKERFGRPIREVEPPEMVITDTGPAFVGGKYEEFPHPEWWFKWELCDALRTKDEYDSTINPEIYFVPTHWRPAKPPPP